MHPRKGRFIIEKRQGIRGKEISKARLFKIEKRCYEQFFLGLLLYALG